MSLRKPSQRFSTGGYTNAQTPPRSHARCSSTSPCGSSSRSTASAVSPGTTVRREPWWGMLVWLGLFLLVGIAAVLALRSALERPDVSFSYLTGECVLVVNADGRRGDCNNLPEKYNKVWVD